MVETAEQDKTETRVQAVYETLHEGELSDVSRLVHEMHPAEAASLLEALPVEERGVVWDLIKTELGGEILTHVNENVRATLIRDMEPDEVIAATEHLDPDDLADIIPELPEETIQRAVGLFVLGFAAITLALFGYAHTELEVLPIDGRQPFFIHMFEAVSAFNTVGLSLGATGDLSAGGRWLTIFLMYVGRVGPLVFAAALARRAHYTKSIRYSYEDVVIG